MAPKATGTGPVPSGVLERRFRSQLLAGKPATSPAEVARRLLAVQAQDLRGARLAVRARSAGLAASDVEAALGSGELVVSTLNRGTLHLVDRDDYRWLHPLTTPQLRTGNRRRLEQEGVEPKEAERGVEVIAAELAAHGPRGRKELRQALEREGVPTAGQAFIHLIFAATLDGLVVRGPLRDGRQAFVAVADWLGPGGGALAIEDEEHEQELLARLARRYLAGHGPATAADLSRWAGITLGRARKGIAAISGELDGDPAGDALVSLEGADHAAGPPPPRMLGAFEPVLLGWQSRTEILGEAVEAAGEIVSGGIFRPFALVGGRARGVWRLDGGEPVLEAFGRLRRPDREALEADAADVTRFLAS